MRARPQRRSTAKKSTRVSFWAAGDSPRCWRLGMIMFCKAETERGRGGVVQTPCAPSSCPQAGWPWSCSTVADPYGPLHAVCAGAVHAGRDIRRVLEEEGCPPVLELEPQLSKWVWGQYPASPYPRGSSSAVSPTAHSTLQQDK